MYNTTVAKLLAKENIEIQYGNYTTAWFDIQSRTLGLPILKDMGKDVHDLFIGHEVGHALHTPYEGWHDTPENLEGCPRSYINVIEDARIEKLIRGNYPGLVAPFARGYKVLFDEKFFGDLSDVDWDQVKLIDKINLKAKLNNLIDVPFNNEEAVLFNKTMNTETFEEVLDVVREVLAYTQDNTPELIEQPEQPESAEDNNDISSQEDDESVGPSGHDDYDKPEGDDNQTQGQGDSNDEEDSSKENQETTANAGGSENEEEDSNDSEEKITTASKEPNHNPELDQATTDIIFRDNEKRLIETDDSGNQISLGRDLGKETIKNSVVPFKQLMEERGNEAFTGVNHNILDDYAEYMRGVKKSVAVATKEFEMKKAAFQWQRAASAKTGSLDLNALHAYKTNDDIFKRVTQLPNAKNHGMMMLIDYSGSMASTLPQVVDQLIHLVTFCKAINIPFDVYAFTTKGYSYDDTDRMFPERRQVDGEVEWDELRMPQLISSSLSKADYELALKHLYAFKLAIGSRYSRTSDGEWFDVDQIISKRSEQLGSTPLNTALMTAHHLIKKFRKVNNIEKMNLVVLSDGDSNGLRVVRDYNMADKLASTSSWSGPMKIVVDNKMVHIPSRRRGATEALLKNLQKRYGVTTLGFFIAQDAHDWKSKIHEISDYCEKVRSDMTKQYTKNKVAIKDNVIGYDRFFMLKPGKDLEADNEGFDSIETDEMSTAQIRNSFKKYAKSKKNNKVLMKQLGGVVA